MNLGNSEKPQPTSGLGRLSVCRIFTRARGTGTHHEPGTHHNYRLNSARRQPSGCAPAPALFIPRPCPCIRTMTVRVYTLTVIVRQEWDEPRICAVGTTPGGAVEVLLFISECRRLEIFAAAVRERLSYTSRRRISQLAAASSSTAHRQRTPKPCHGESRSFAS